MYDVHDTLNNVKWLTIQYAHQLLMQNPSTHHQRMYVHLNQCPPSLFTNHLHRYYQQHPSHTTYDETNIPPHIIKWIYNEIRKHNE